MAITVALRRIDKDPVQARPANGAKTLSVYAADASGRAAVDSTDAPFLIANGGWVLDGPIGQGFYQGAGAPSLSATPGSLYIRTDGSSASTRIYLNCSAAPEGTTWIAISTAS